MPPGFELPRGSGQLWIPLRIGYAVVVPPVETEAEGKLWCFGKVLRVEKELKEGKFGMAIGFQRCQVLSEA